jgi:DNA relaxase NicK
MILTAILENTQPLATRNAPQAHSALWNEKTIAHDPVGFTAWLAAQPEHSSVAPDLIDAIRSRYPASFVENVTDPPHVIRGLDSQITKGIYLIGFDYVRVTASVSRLQETKDLIQHYYPDLIFQRSCGRLSYALGERSDLGIMLNYTPHNCADGLNPGLMSVDLPGKALAALTRENALRLCTDLAVLNFRPSRIDLKLRDFDKLITPYQLSQLTKKRTDKGAEVTGFRKANFVQSPSDIGKDSTEGTMYLGRRTSSRLLRVYDALEKHGVNAIDWEVELKDEKAKEAWDSILNAWQATNDIQATYKLMGSIIIGSVNFVERTDKNINRCEQKPFWKRMCNGLEAFKLVTQKPRQTIENSKKWIKKSVAKTLTTVIFHGLGVTVSEIKEKGIEKVFIDREESIKNHLFRLAKEVELGMNHIDRLSAAENRPQATNSFSPLFQT